MKKIFYILILFMFLLPSSYFIEASAEMEKRPVSLTAQESQLTPPETLDEAKQIGEKALEVGEKELPGIIQRVWREEVMPIWQKMFDWFKENWWPKITDWFKKIIQPEIDKRKPLIEEEFQKEKEEMKEEVKSELPEVGKSLWEKFKKLIN